MVHTQLFNHWFMLIKGINPLVPLGCCLISKARSILERTTLKGFAVNWTLKNLKLSFGAL